MGTFVLEMVKMIFLFAKLFEQKMQSNSSYIPKKNHTFVQSIKFNPPPLNRKPQNHSSAHYKKNPYCK